MRKVALGALLSMAVVVLEACAPAANRLEIRTAQDPEACPGAALPVPFHFRIDPVAEDQVIAIGNDGSVFPVYWAPGFVGGEVADPVVRDPNGIVVARDGEVVEGPLLHGYTICATGNSLKILLL